MKEIATPDTVSSFRLVERLLNIFVPATIAVCTEWNLWIFTISFILFDILMCSIDWIIFFVIPHWKTIHVSLEDAQKRLSIYEKKRNKLKEAVVADIACDGDCLNCWRTHCSAMEKAGLDIYDRFINDEKTYIAAEIKQLEIEKAESEVDKQSKDFTDKKEYLASASLRIKVLIENENMDFLKPTYQAIEDLRETLNKKPMGYTMISDMLYIYTDELLKIVAKLKDLDEEQINKYMPDIQKISKYLSQHVNDIEDRIIKLETDDIEVGIAVLLKELSDKGEKEDA
ncbi:MAG: hypothetical protein IJ419_12165 [Agathobacter sp.]|nr:hypothetical protein [Agathobacter sp.]